MKIGLTFTALVLLFLFNGSALYSSPEHTQVANPGTDSLQTDSVTFQKGRMLSILIGIRKPGMDEAWRSYVNTIFPLAMKYQYDPGSAFNVLEPTRGNYHPGFVAMASWPSAGHRDNFQNDPSLPKDLAQQRRNIWSRFDQLFYKELETTISFEVRSDKVYAFTAHWIADAKAYQKYEKNSLAKMKQHKGRLLTQLPDGYSPKNHLYDPDVLLISEWDNVDAFKTYLKELEQYKPDDGLKNTNEFVCAYVFNF